MAAVSPAPSAPPAPRWARSDFDQPTLDVARALLGQRLVRVEKGRRLSGLICEVEAYVGQTDQACHARAGITPRTRVMFGPPGRTYVYFTYGLHWLLNFITEAEGFPAAVLIRALQPEEGVEHMRRRRAPAADLANGPAKLTQALNIDGALNDHDACAPQSILFIERTPRLPDHALTARPRIGLGRTPEPWRSMPWNWRWDR